MAINLVTKFSPLVDEKFTAESKTSLVTNKDYDFIGAHSIKIYSVGVAPMNDYGRNTTGTSRYGEVNDLSNETQEVSMEKDRSFTFAIDKMDEDETLGALNAGSALARQLREVVIPEVDVYTYGKMSAGAGKTVTETITDENAYGSILAGTEYQDEKMVPSAGKVVVCTPAFYTHLKKDKNAILETEIGQNMRIKGVVSNMDGVTIQKVPSSFLPENTNFILAHSIATTQAIKLAEYKINNDPQGISGSLVEGRIYYTAFVRKNKADALYVSVSA
jgi:hypothetical protein